MEKIAIIPARGGSKRIYRKNIKNFLGKPIIAYSIEVAIQSKLFDEIMVSTDSEEIAAVAKKYGASVPFMRSKKNADDFATSADVLIEVLEDYKKIGKEFEYFCCIYPTAPFVTAKKLKDAYNLMTGKNSDSVIPVVRFSYPIQRAFRINNLGNIEYIWLENINKRSQDIEPVYHDAGQFYWCELKSFLKSKSLVSAKTIPLLISEMEVQDIDSQNDWDIAEIKYKLLKKEII
ncbi:MAG: pseudaminic acid cytidylyltransferase [Ignavibacteriaceae bacterium]